MFNAVSYTHLRSHETAAYLECRQTREKNIAGGWRGGGWWSGRGVGAGLSGGRRGIA